VDPAEAAEVGAQRLQRALDRRMDMPRAIAALLKSLPVANPDLVAITIRSRKQCPATNFPTFASEPSPE
jgi:hypothetical protein